jgi:alpha-L-fucosidase 2
MVFGGIHRERIQFNEHTLWTGEPHEYQHPGAYASLPALRELLFQGRQKEAEDLATTTFMSLPLGQKAYQAFGDLLVEFPNIEEKDVTDYRRDLNLETAVASVRYRHNGVTFLREVFASYPAQVVVVRISASKPGRIALRASLASAHKAATFTAPSPNQISMAGQVDNGVTRFEARVQVVAEGGQVEAGEPGIRVEAANAVTLILSGATSFKNYRDVSGEPAARNDATLTALGSATYEALKQAHVADHQRLFRRVTLDLGRSAAARLETDERVRSFAGGNDPQLVALLFQYGRYLLIGSSRKGGQPANLQGLWNGSNRPPWDSKYTCNINTEMNYWPAELANLSECHEPLFDALKELAESGAKTAKEHYNARGWVLHHNFDLWRGTAPINASNHGIWPTGGAWLATHLWEHYLFTGDKQFLRETAYPLLKGSAMFFVDYLVEDPMRGWLISGPSNSPEQGGLVMGPTMDHQIIRSLFGAVIAAGGILDTDAALRADLTRLRPRIAPNQVGRYGQLQEWLEDKDDPKNQHRHVSHLWGVYPGGEITAWGTPELFNAARQSLEFRGDAATGWSMGWKANLWARFQDGNRLYRILSNLIRPVSGKSQAGGLYPNLFDAHPPFQIDGNFGATAGIAEMLLQSHDPYAKPPEWSAAQSGASAVIVLLPALPDAFRSGRVTGLRARGSFEVDLEWRGGKLRRATLRAGQSMPLEVRYGTKRVSVRAEAGGTYRFDGDLKAR